MLFEVTAEPVFEVLGAFAGRRTARRGNRHGLAIRAEPASLFIGRLDGVVEANEAATRSHLLRELVEVRERGMPAATVRVNDNRVGLGDDVIRRPLAAEADGDGDAVSGTLLEASR